MGVQKSDFKKRWVNTIIIEVLFLKAVGCVIAESVRLFFKSSYLLTPCSDAPKAQFKWLCIICICIGNYSYMMGIGNTFLLHSMHHVQLVWSEAEKQNQRGGRLITTTALEIYQSF